MIIVEDLIFRYNGVKFVFNQPKYNFISRYKDINKLEMVIHTVMTSEKYGAYPDIEGVTLNFTLTNNEHFTVNQTPPKLNIRDFIYMIIGVGRAVEHFSYSFDGAGAEEMEDLKETMDNYYNFGYRPLLSPSAEILLKAASFIMLGALIFVLVATRNNPNLSAPLFIFFLVMTFIADITLLADKFGKNKHETIMPCLNTIMYDNLLGKISPVQIILIKIAIIIAVLYIFPHSFI